MFRPIEYCPIPLPKKLISERFGKTGENDKLEKVFFKTSLSPELQRRIFQSAYLLDGTFVQKNIAFVRYECSVSNESFPIVTIVKIVN